MITPTLELVSHTLCPYVQRSVICLKEKGVSYTRTDIDLGDKPDWFVKTSPLGKVPLLIIDGRHTLFESAVICEYLDEITHDSLLPSAPLAKAYQKSWIEYASQILNNIARLYSASTQEEYRRVLTGLQQQFERLEPEVQSQPLFSGAELTLVDAAYAPVFRYFDVMDRYLSVPVFKNCPKISAWRAQLMQRDSVSSSVHAQYPSLLKQFLLNKNSLLSSEILRLDAVFEH